MFGSFSSLQGSLFDEFWRLHHEAEEALADGLTSSSGLRSWPRGTYPAINVVQTPTQVQVYLFAPGIDPKQLNVSIQQNLLTIEGQRPRASESKATYYRQERFGGQFHRAISLSDDIDPQLVEASYRDGIVQITLHRREAAKPRQIEIH
jgi:HSP20 family protein